MSWPGEDWTVGLTGHVLLKVKQLQTQNEKLNKERQQRQLQLDNSEAALHKQKQKYDEMRVDLAAVQRELGGVREAAQAEVRTRERLAHDLQVKTAQAHSLEGQLESAKNLTQSLNQEIKRLEAELEKLQKGNGSGDSVLFSTPCWNMSSPRDHSGGFRAEEHVRQQLHFGDIPKPVVGVASSPFPQQPQKSPPLRRHIRQSEASTPSSVFPWERDDLWSTPKGRPASSVSSGEVTVKSNASGIEEALRNEVDGLRVRVSDLQRKAQLESERLKDVESRLAQALRDLSTKEQSLTRTQEQLTRAETRITQETDRTQVAEQRVKQLQDELKCQRQNAESSRCNAEQRRRDMEREHQRELLEQQRERQALEKQHQQEINKLNQEIQQARTLHNALQTQHDKVCFQKQGLERDLEDVRGQLKNTETDLRESQKRETQTEAKLTEALKENESLTVSLGQMKKQEKALQEEVKRLTEELAEALKLIKELQAQLDAPPQPVSVPLFSSGGDCFSPSTSLHDRSPPHQHATQRKRVPQAVRTREEERTKYPSGREPGEGIDSEHIENFEYEKSQKLRAKGVTTHQSGSMKRSETDVDISLTEQDTAIEDMDADSLMFDSTSGTMSNSESHIPHNPTGNVGKRDSVSLKDLKKDNSELRDELRDVKHELQKRLEDLESQRRAEAETRTKLKQLSRKHTTQTEQHRAKTTELKDSVTKLETQLEQEKKESTKLRKDLDELQRGAEKRQEEKERDRDESIEMERLMDEEMTRLKKELKDLELKLEREREERKREEEERKQIQQEEVEGLKIAQLQEQLGRIEETISKENVPVAYLQLAHHSNTNSTALVENEDAVPSPESICDSANLHNTIISKETRATELIMDLRAQEGKTSAPQKPQALLSETADLDNTTILVLEIEKLRMEKDRESEKANLAQGKLEDLQKQVNTQTKNLTQAFESQSKHIENLLKELCDKELVLKRQTEELQKCQEKIALLEAQHTKEDVVFSEADTHLEPSTEISRELSCDSVISNMSISDREMYIDDINSLPVENIEETNTRNVSNKLQILTEVSKPLTSDTYCEYPSSSSVISELSDLFIGNDEETVTRESEDHTTGDDHELKRVIKELREAQIQLNVLKTQNEGGEEELLSVKQENEELKAKVRYLQCQDVAVPSMNGENDHLSEEGFLDRSSFRQESVVSNKSFEDEQTEGFQSEHSSEEKVHFLQVQIRTLREQIQNLSEQNRTKAEELELWTLGEIESNNSPSTILNEFEIFLSCKSTKLLTQQTRTMMPQCTTDTTRQCGSENRHDTTSLPETQMTHTNESESQGLTEGLIIGNKRPLTVKSESRLVNDGDETPSVCASDMMSVNTKDGPSPVHQTNSANGPDDDDEDVSIPSKVISPITEPSENHRSQNSDLCAVHDQIETADKHGYLQGDSPDKHDNRHSAAVGSPSRKNESSQGQSSEMAGIIRDPNRMEVGDVQSVFTQTEASGEPGDPSVKHTGTQTENMEEDESDKEPADVPLLSQPTPPVTNQLLFATSDPAHLAERIRQNRNRMSAAYDDTEYEPYGLPEVVMKGFADIPSGPACPYVLRRGLLGTAAMPLPVRETPPQEENEDIEP